MPAQRSEFERAKESLLLDPTTANPRVVELDYFPYQPGTYLLAWGEILVTFEFENPLVIRVLAIAIRPDLPGLLQQ